MFQILTVGWIQHDLQKPYPLITDKQERKIEINTRCSERLAVAEFSSKLPVTQEHIRSLVQDEFKYESTDIEKEFDSYIKYARDSTFLTVESNNSFCFLLKPLREYFVASRMIREINFYDKSKKIDCLLLKNISPEIFDFIKSITEATWLIKPHFIQKHTKNKAIISKIDKSDNLVKIIDDNRDKKTWMGNVVKILHRLRLIKYAMNLSYLNLEQIELAEADLNHAYFSNSNLKNSKLKNSNLSNVDFSYSDLTEADLSSSMLYRADFKRATIFNTNFDYSNLPESKFNNSNIKNTKFHFSNLAKSKFDKNSTIDNVIFNNSNLTGADFIEANVKKIDFQKSLLNGALFNEKSFNDAAMLKKLYEAGVYFRVPK